MLLGDAPHLDHEVCSFDFLKTMIHVIMLINLIRTCLGNYFDQYAIFGKVTKGDETLKKLEELPTHREGIFVMVSVLHL